jgi:hypothetical protein
MQHYIEPINIIPWAIAQFYNAQLPREFYNAQLPREFYNAQLPREFCIFFSKGSNILGKKLHNCLGNCTIASGIAQLPREFCIFFFKNLKHIKKKLPRELHNCRPIVELPMELHNCLGNCTIA